MDKTLLQGKNPYKIKVDVTRLSPEEKREILICYRNKVGYVKFSTAWKNQFSPQKRLFYIFWYEQKPDIPQIT